MRFCSIKPFSYLIAFLSLLGSIAVAWAGAAEDIGAINQQRTAAFEKGDVDGYMVAFADNGVLTPALQPFRVEGKAAIKEYITTLFQTYPTAPHRRRTGLHARVWERHFGGVRCVPHSHSDRQKRHRQRLPPPRQHDVAEDGQRVAHRGSARVANAHSLEPERGTSNIRLAVALGSAPAASGAATQAYRSTLPETISGSITPLQRLPERSAALRFTQARHLGH